MTREARDGTRSAAVLGAGAWGTALALQLARQGFEVRLWARRPELVEAMAADRENAFHLPGVRLSPLIRPTASMVAAVASQPLVVFAPPSHAFRQVLEGARGALCEGALLVSATKGIEVEGLRTMSRILDDLLPASLRPRVAVLSGPSFASEVAAGHPTAVVAAARDAAMARAAQGFLSGGGLRVYAGTDVPGVELGGAIKNVIAIAAGVADGLALGPNARAALITRGLAEVTRLGLRLGARPATLAGLAGLGDLVLTCTGELSRNRTLGMHLAQGESLLALQAKTRSVAEGVNTCRSVARLAEREGVEMPICQAVHRVLFEGTDPRAALEQLMTRGLRFEEEG
jgi:glycerol-3-phosphate dehydrogenase (NAD(P)+)